MEPGDRELLSIKRLQNCENWNVWKFQVSIILKAQRAWEIVQGTKVLPVLMEDATEVQKREHDRACAEWYKADAIAQKVIVTTISEQSMLHIINCNNAKEMWIKLEDIYEQKSEASVHILQQKWFTMSKEPSDDMATHIAKIENLAYKLQAAGEIISDKMIMTKILLTLPSSYSHFVSAWESTSEIERTKTNLIARLSIEELREKQREGPINNNALTSRTKFSYNKARGARGGGSYQSRGQSSQNSQNSQNRNQNPWKPGRCNVCNKPGHWAKDCYRNRTENKNKGYHNSQANGIPHGDALLSEALVSMQQKNEVVDHWYLDSGATQHMTHKREWYVSYESLKEQVWVRIGDGTYLKAYGRGDINILAYNGEEWKESHLSNVLYVPKLKYNLFSSGATLDKGLRSYSDKRYTKFYKDKNIVAVGERKNSLYVMKFMVEKKGANKIQSQPTTAAVVINTDSLESWHQKFAHQSFARTREILKHNNIKFKDADESFCRACAIGKSHRLPFPNSKTKTEYIGEIIHADVCGPIQVESMRGYKYFLLLKDDYSHYRHVYFMMAKSDVCSCLEDFIKKTEKHCPRGIKYFRTDNGLEFVNQKVRDLLCRYGIQHQRTVAYCPEQNGSAERENRTVMEAARTILHSVGFEKKFWAEAINTVVYVLNHTGTSSIKNVTPYELWYGKKPQLKNLHIFGEIVFAHIPKQHRQKLDDNSKESRFLGYEELSKGYRVWFPDEGTVKIVRNVIFSGIIEPVKKFEPKDSILLDLPQNQEEKNNEEEPDEPENNLLDNLPEEQPNEEDAERNLLEEEDNLPKEEDNLLKEEDNLPKEEDNLPRRRLRDRSLIKRPGWYNDYVNIEDTFIAENEEPFYYTEAVGGNDANKWKEAMEEEIKALNKNQVWELVDKPEGAKMIENRWVYKIKRDTNGKILRYKARLVAKGFKQKPGIDYQETFSPVVRMSSIRLLLTIAANEGLILRQFDIKTAFLNGDLEEVIYMNQPEGFSNGTDQVCKLIKSLYGLKQSSRCWNKRFTDFLRKHRLKATIADPCIFYSTDKSKRLILAIHVDDGLVAAENVQDIINLLKDLQQEFEITHSSIGTFLGIQMEQREDRSIFIHQAAYTRKVIQKFNLENANAVSIPADPNHEMCTEMHPVDQREIIKAPYREAVGSLMYLSTCTRPDICYAVNKASRYLEKPTKIQWNAVKRIIKYLNGTQEYGLMFKKNKLDFMEAYSDADFGGELETRRSTTGYLVKWGSSVISWNSKRQESVALSTTEAEYVAACHTAKEIMWLRKLLGDLYNLDKIKMVMHVDNQGAIQLIKNPVFHKKTKHIDMSYNFVKERYAEKVFELKYINTNEQLADILTKPLARPAFLRHRNNICDTKGRKKE